MKKPNHNSIKNKFLGFPKAVEMIEEGEYNGRIDDIYLTSDKSKIVLKVAIYVDDNKEIYLSKKYDNENKVTCNSQLWWFVNSFGLIGKDEKIIWENLINMTDVLVDVVHGEFGCYIKSIKPCAEGDADYEDSEDEEYDYDEEEYE